MGKERGTDRSDLPALLNQGHFKVGRSLINQFAWNNGPDEGGWDANIDSLRQIHPDLMTLEQWIRTIDWRAGL